MNLERCKACNFAVEMLDSKEENMIFTCPSCEKSWCRLCERPWNNEHFGLSCHQLDQKYNVDKNKRELERKLNEAVVRKCQCGLQFTKADGCNKMTCRCGCKQCYICGAKDIDYGHFCQHELPPGVTECKECAKPCRIWCNTELIDQENINRIQTEAAKAGIVLNDDPANNNSSQEDDDPQMEREAQIRAQLLLQQRRREALEAEQRRREALEAEQRRREPFEAAQRRREALEAEKRRREDPEERRREAFEAAQRRREAFEAEQRRPQAHFGPQEIKRAAQLQAKESKRAAQEIKRAAQLQAKESKRAAKEQKREARLEAKERKREAQQSRREAKLQAK